MVVFIGQSDALWHNCLIKIVLFFPMLHDMVKVFNLIKKEDKNQKYTVEKRGEEVDSSLTKVVVAIVRQFKLAPNRCF